MAKNKGGRPAHVPTDERRRMVEALVAFGIKQESIAEIIGIGVDTLRTHYGAEISVGADKLTAQVANSLVKKALSDRPDAVNAAKFYLQAKAGWTEKVESSVTVKHEDSMDAVHAELERRRKARDGESSVH